MFAAQTSVYSGSTNLQFQCFSYVSGSTTAYGWGYCNAVFYTAADGVRYQSTGRKDTGKPLPIVYTSSTAAAITDAESPVNSSYKYSPSTYITRINTIQDSNTFNVGPSGTVYTPWIDVVNSYASGQNAIYGVYVLAKNISTGAVVRDALYKTSDAIYWLQSTIQTPNSTYPTGIYSHRWQWSSSNLFNFGTNVFAQVSIINGNGLN